MKSIHVVFQTITKDEWREFSGEVRRMGETITRVLIRAIREYMKEGRENDGKDDS